MRLPTSLDQLPDAKIRCLRCQVVMKDAGQIQLHEGPSGGLLGEPGRPRIGLLEVELTLCPKCGKVEFFI